MHGPSLSPSSFGRFSSRFAVYISRPPTRKSRPPPALLPPPPDDLLSIILIFLSRRLVLATSGNQHWFLYGFVLLTSCRPLVNNIRIASSFHTPRTPPWRPSNVDGGLPRRVGRNSLCRSFRFPSALHPHPSSSAGPCHRANELPRDSSWHQASSCSKSTSVQVRR